MLLILLAVTAAYAGTAHDDAASGDFRSKAIKNNLTEWNGISWDDPPEQLGENGILVEMSGDTAAYVVRDETAVLGGANIGEIKYRFKRGKLAALDFICATQEDDARVKGFAVERFGAPQKVSEEGDILRWADSYESIYVVDRPGERAFLRFVHLRRANRDYELQFRLRRIKNRPDGYGGLAWGDSPEKLGENGSLTDVDDTFRMSLYKKKEKAGSYLGCSAEEARYYFHRQRLVDVCIYFDKSNDEESLRLRALEHFGNAAVIRADEREYIWGDEESVISLEIFEGGGGEMWLGTKNLPGEAMAAPHRKEKWTDRASDEFAGGDGTEKDPFAIATPEQFARLAIIVNGGNAASGVYFKLVSDIDLSGGEWTPIGVSLKDRAFNGQFDGGGHVITALSTPPEAVFLDFGLFGIVSGDATVKNTIVREADVAGVESRAQHVGMIAGTNYGTLEGCFASGGGIGNAISIGGIVGFNWGTVKNCSADVTIEGGKNGYWGGIVGFNSGSVENCSANAKIFGNGTLGGIAGSNLFQGTINGTVDKCEASGIIRGDMDDKKTVAGGIAGFNFDESSVTDCKADNTASGKTAGGVVGLNLGRVAGCSFNEGRYASKISPIGSQPMLMSIIVKSAKTLTAMPVDEKFQASAANFARFALIIILIGIAAFIAQRVKKSKKINHS